MHFLKVNQANVKASKAMSTAIRLEAISSRLEAMALKVKANKAIVCTTSKVTFCLALPLLVFMRTRHNNGNKGTQEHKQLSKSLFFFVRTGTKACFLQSHILASKAKG